MSASHLHGQQQQDLDSQSLASSGRRGSQLPLLSGSHGSIHGTGSSSHLVKDPDYSSPSLPFSPYSPPNLLSSRFNQEMEQDEAVDGGPQQRQPSQQQSLSHDHEDESDLSEAEETDISVSSANDSPARPKVLQKKKAGKGFDQDLTKQRVYLEEEDVDIVLNGYRYIQWHLWLYYLACVFSAGIVFLLGRWMPRQFIACVAERCDLARADWIVVENEYGQIAMEPVFAKYYGGPLNSVFNVAQMEKLSYVEELDTTLVTGIMHDMRYFDYQYIRFIFNPALRIFMQNAEWKDVGWTNAAVCERGIGRETHQERLMIFGQNLIDVKEKSVGQLLVQEVLHPFYIFQVFSMALWFADDYYYYAACILVISTVSVVTELVETKATMRRMRDMSRFTCETRVFRSGRWRYLSSSELVPGDIFEITDTQLQVFPCDALLLSGDCIVNESMLTGESVPVSKIPITDISLRRLDLSLANIPADQARHFLFSGTKIVRARPGAAPSSLATKKNASGANGVGTLPTSKSSASSTYEDDSNANQPLRGTAMVVRTGFNTTKGTLIRSMLFPKPNTFQFYRDSFRFIGILACIAGVGFCLSTINFVRMGVPFKNMIVKALDLITIVVPPALPATMSIGTSFAIARLKRSSIFCISPTRVNIGGKINCMCFDKTGTLTEDGLDVLGVQCPDKETGKFGEMLESIDKFSTAPKSLMQNCTSMLYAMTTCHSVKSLNGDLIGDPLDLKMFDFTKWILEEAGLGSRTATVNDGKGSVGHAQGASNGIVSTIVRPPNGHAFSLDDMLEGGSPGVNGTGNNSPTSAAFLELGIIRCFEFVSSLRRMSVIVKRLHSPGMDIYVKGAPEVMTDICLKESLPSDYHSLLSYYTHHGYRVIACASKSMPTLNFIRAQRVKREQVESELTFLGFIVFENKLKPTTAPVIETLSNARIRQVMCTGDNVLTAISVSRECGLIGANKQVYTPRFVQGDSTTEFSEIVWEHTDDARRTLDSRTLKPVKALDTLPIGGSDGILNSNNSDHLTAGLDFPRFSESLMNDHVLAVTGDCFRWMVDFAPTSTLNRMLVMGQIFARMSPDEKHELVECLQEIGYCVGFCGDGANDCGALKAADVGISLSEAEASVAAPFTSRSNDIHCVVKVIQEGRAALVTSFSCFKYMALYSIIQFTTVSFLYAFASNLGDFQFLYIDLVLILPIAVLMGRTESYPILNPKQPTANLVSKKVITSLLGQITIQSSFQALLFFWVRLQPWYTPPVYKGEDKNIECYENTVLFLLSCFQYLLVAIVFSVGPPYRKPMVSNRPFVGTIIGLSVVTAVMLLFPNEWMTEVLQFMPVPFSFRMLILIMAGVDLVVSLGAEYYLFPRLAKWIGESLNLYRMAKENNGRSTSASSLQSPHVGYGSHNSVRYAALPNSGSLTEVNVVPVDEEARIGGGHDGPHGGAMATTGNEPGDKKKKMSNKIYKLVEEEMLQP